MTTDQQIVAFALKHGLDAARLEALDYGRYLAYWPSHADCFRAGDGVPVARLRGGRYVRCAATRFDHGRARG